MKKIILACTFILLLAVGAQAGTVIDFTDFVISSPLGDTYNTTVPIIGIGDVRLRFRSLVDADSNEDSLLWWDDEDGFGVQYSYEQGEIESPEYLLMRFVNGPFVLNRFGVADLFNDDYLEIGKYRTSNSTDWISFEALPDQYPNPVSNGERWVDVNEAVEWVRFWAPGILQNGQSHEFALQQIEVSTVPVPPAVLLLGSGIIGLVGLRRKFRKK